MKRRVFALCAGILLPGATLAKSARDQSQANRPRLRFPRGFIRVAPSLVIAILIMASLPAVAAAVNPTVPGAPTGVSAIALPGSAQVSWGAPVSNGGAAITLYTVTSSPGGFTCTKAAAPLVCTVTGLTNGTPYTFTVRATNSAGTGAVSNPSLAVTPVAAFSVTLAASATSVTPGTAVTLTATANQDITSTPWYIVILDSSNTVIAHCGNGTACTASVTSSTATSVTYHAVIGTITGASPQGTSAPVTVAWALAPLSVTLAASATSATPGTAVTLTATANQDITYTPWYIVILDSSNTVITHCGNGTACTAPVTSSTATSVTYHAVIGTIIGTTPQATSGTVTVAWTLPLSVTLAASATSATLGTAVLLVATANGDITSTPWYIVILDSSNNVIASCGNGTTCSAAVTSPTATSVIYHAVIGTSTGASPQASYGPVTVTWSATALSVTLAAGATIVTPGTAVTLTATANRAIDSTPWYIVILNGSNTVMWSCGNGTTCAVPVTSSTATSVTYTAVIGTSTGASPQAISSPVTVTWTSAALSVTLAASATSVTAGTVVTLTATTNQDLTYTPWYMVILDSSNNVINVWSCGNGHTCSVHVLAPFSVSFHAVVGAIDGTSPQATSGTVTVTWTAPALSVTLAASATSVTTGAGVTLTATTNGDITSTPWYMVILDSSNNAVASCGNGTTCSASVTSSTATSVTYHAVVGTITGASPQAISGSQTVVWTAP